MIFINCCFIGVILTFYEMCLIFGIFHEKHDLELFFIIFKITTIKQLFEFKLDEENYRESERI